MTHQQVELSLKGVLQGCDAGQRRDAERVELDRAAQACLDQGFVCWPEPAAFTRDAIYAFIALLEVIVLFSVSLRVEAKIRRRGYDPEWR